MSEKFSKEMAAYYALLSELISSGDVEHAIRVGMNEKQVESVLRLIAGDAQGPQVARKRLLEAAHTLVHVSNHLRDAASRGDNDSELLGEAAKALGACDFDRAADLLKALEQAAEGRDSKDGGSPDADAARAAFTRGELDVSRNRWEDAYGHFRRAAEISPDDWEFLGRASHFAWKNERFAEALEYDRRRLTIAESSKDPRKISTALADLGLSLKESGRLQESIEMYQRAIDIDVVDLGEDSIDVATDYSNLAVALHDLGDYEKTVFYAEKAVVIGAKHLAETDSTLLSWKNTLAAAFHVVGRHEDGIKLLEEVVAVAEVSLPENDPSLARKFVNLGKMYEKIGRLQDAKALLLRALDIYEKTYSIDALTTTGTLNRLGVILQKMGNYHEALSHFERSMSIIKHYSNDEGLDFASVANNLAVLYGYLGRFDDAIQLVGRSLEIRQNILPQNHPYIKSAKENLENIKNASLVAGRLQ